MLTQKVNSMINVHVPRGTSAGAASWADVITLELASISLISSELMSCSLNLKCENLLKDIRVLQLAQHPWHARGSNFEWTDEKQLSNLFRCFPLATTFDCCFSAHFSAVSCKVKAQRNKKNCSHTTHLLFPHVCFHCFERFIILIAHSAAQGRLACGMKTIREPLIFRHVPELRFPLDDTNFNYQADYSLSTLNTNMILSQHRKGCEWKGQRFASER